MIPPPMFESEAVVRVLVSSSAYRYWLVKSSSAVVTVEDVIWDACFCAFLSVSVSS